jgi:prepilin peptidase CpaA
MPIEAFVLIGAALLATAALHDAAFRTVPNLVCAGLALCGLALRCHGGDLLGGTIAAVIVFAAATGCWMMRWMGGGDVKLLGAAALMVPPAQVPAMLVLIALAGGVLTLPYLAARHRLRAPATRRPANMLARIVRTERRRLRQGGPLPYAVAIAAGVGVVIFQGSPS